MLFDTLEKTKITKGVMFKLLIGVLIYFGILYSGPIITHVSRLAADDIVQGFENYNTRQVVIGESTFTAVIADTSEKRKQGLSGQESLSDGASMLFVFSSPGSHGIWMKNMSFPIDIVWIDGMGTVVHIEEGAAPDSYPEIFRSPKDAIRVLEINAGVVKEEGIKIGDQFTLL